jgi:hypothetical protein
MRPPSIRAAHQSVACMVRRHSAEVFQSSWTSWSSNTIAVGSVDSTQRMSGSLHASR